MDNDKIKNSTLDEIYPHWPNGSLLVGDKESFSFNKYSFWIDENIREPSYYRQLIATLNRACENDTIELNINSLGGRLDSALAITAAIKACYGFVNCTLYGECASAATLLALSCNTIVVTENASMMIHTASYGYHGKDQEIGSYVAFNTKRIREVLSSFYEGFCTEEEIEKVLSGSDFHLNSKQIVARLKKREKYFKKKEVDLTTKGE